MGRQARDQSADWEAVHLLAVVTAPIRAGGYLGCWACRTPPCPAVQKAECQGVQRERRQVQAGRLARCRLWSCLAGASGQGPHPGDPVCSCCGAAGEAGVSCHRHTQAGRARQGQGGTMWRRRQTRTQKRRSPAWVQWGCRAKRCWCRCDWRQAGCKVQASPLPSPCNTVSSFAAGYWVASWHSPGSEILLT